MVDLHQRREIKVENFESSFISAIGKVNEKELNELLKKSNLTISTAESLTGGMISKKLTAMPGSSNYFTGGIICYNTRVKISLVGVPAPLIVKYGEVSFECAKSLAQSVRLRLKTQIGLSATGVAGPSGVGSGKPIGLVYIALASENDCQVKELHLKGSREEIRKKSASAALGLLYQHLKGG